MNRALITGATGQDASFLAKYLLDNGYKVFATYRRLSTPNFWRLQHLGIFEKVHLIPADLIDPNSIVEALQIAKPNMVFHLASQSFVGASFEQPVGTGEITGLGTTRILEAIRQVAPMIKIYNAATSELYGFETSGMQNEDTPLHPASPYGAAKLYSYWMTKIYREGYDIFACNGILYNHESELRGMDFVTRKITNAVAKIKLGLLNSIELGNLDAKRDWGYAPDYCESMVRMLERTSPDDYVIATGESHSVREFAQKAFEVVNLDWEDYVVVDKKYLRPVDVMYHCGDCSKAKKVLGWEPKVKFDRLVEIMVEADLDRWTRWKRGEQFPWDACNYLGEANIVSRMQNRGG